MSGITKLFTLPAELLINILEELQWGDLLACKLVCRSLNDIVTASPSLQYKIDLPHCGLEDNPEHPLSRTAKIPLLREYQKAWSRIRGFSARKSNSSSVRIEDGPAWELAGGVLAQSIGTKALRFKRTGSRSRGIEESTWDVDYGFNIRDFTMDPGQDLLVALCEPQNADDSYMLNLLSMSNHKHHPLAHNPVLLLPFSQADDFEIRINGSYVGLLVMHALGGAGMDLWSPVMIWNWKTGIKVLAFQNQADEHEYVCSFVFLSDRYVVLAHMTPPLENGALTVIELSDEPEDQEDLPEWATTHPRWTFLLPPCQTESSAIESMELLCDPGPQWQPNTQPIPTSKAQPETSEAEPRAGSQTSTQPPFFLARDDRMIILMMTVMDERSPLLDPYTIRFSISSAHLLAYVRGAAGAFTLRWADWGPESCRAEPQNFIWDGSWPCCVYGTRIAAQHSSVVHTDGQVRRYRPVSLDPNDYEVAAHAVELADFNQAGIRKAVADAGVVPPGTSLSAFFAAPEPVSYQDVRPLEGVDDGFEYYVHPTRLPADFAKFFDDADCVMTCLPYRVCSTGISMNGSENGTEEVQKEGVGLDDPLVNIGPFSAVMLSEDAVVIVREWPEADPDFLIISVQ
ncbi:F-box protein [Phanerochaete sordida]|uniref:F-box protein n=1 Tax=Phanerochaete sordida TaxID=48140 RepID=A0A9P3G5K6_9APHY|nr:F-box protein [Phanerochaete sordida]